MKTHIHTPAYSDTIIQIKFNEVKWEKYLIMLKEERALNVIKFVAFSRYIS